MRIVSSLQRHTLRSRRINNTIPSWRNYTSTTPIFQSTAPETSTDESNTKSEEEELKKRFAAVAAQKQIYKQQLKQTRKKYIAEVSALAAADAAREKSERDRLSKAKQERQTLKNAKSAANAIRQEEKRRERHDEWTKELASTQIKREARKLRFHKARSIILEELEEESQLWMTTPEEVEEKLGGGRENMQKLWARPHSLIGAMPDDATFWRYSADTWKMEKTYRTQADYMLQEIEESVYDRANVDSVDGMGGMVSNMNPNAYWTTERVDRAQELEDRARLRAMVREEAKKYLVRQSLLEERGRNEATKNTAHLLPYRKEVPADHPVREQKVMQDEELVRQVESAIVLSRANLERFFMIDEETGEISVRPYESWPLVLGTMPDRDMRNEKEKARQQKEKDALWKQMDSGVDDEEFDFLQDDTQKKDEAEEDDDEEIDEDFDVDESDDAILKEFNKGSEMDKFSEHDVEYLLEQLTRKVNHLQDQINSGDKDVAEDLAAFDGMDSVSKNNYTAALSILESLTEEQQDAIADLGIGDITSEEDIDNMVKALEQNIDGLTKEQIGAITELERSHWKGTLADSQFNSLHDEFEKIEEDIAADLAKGEDGTDDNNKP